MALSRDEKKRVANSKRQGRSTYTDDGGAAVFLSSLSPAQIAACLDDGSGGLSYGSGGGSSYGGSSHGGSDSSSYGSGGGDSGGGGGDCGGGGGE